MLSHFFRFVVFPTGMLSHSVSQPARRRADRPGGGRSAAALDVPWPQQDGITGVEVFDEFTPKLKTSTLKTSTYGSGEYNGYLEAMGDGLKHHYEVNRHHPEHFPNGVDDMTLVDLIEMLADWKAATERHDDGDLAKSLEIQRERLGLSDQLVGILRNTRSTLVGSMCRADVEPQAVDRMAKLLVDIAQALADQAKVDINSVRIGPVDFGSPDDQRSTA
jgi:hypothetical protein